MTLIATAAASGSSTFIKFNNIPADFTDLLLVGAMRTTEATAATQCFIYFGTTLASGDVRASYDWTALTGNGSSAVRNVSASASQINIIGVMPGSSATSNTFGSFQAYFTNYATSLPKQFSVDAVGENDATTAGQNILAGSNANSNSLSPITSVSFDSVSNLAVGTSFSLYGITKGSNGVATIS
jgi:hypothetical protein